MATLPTIFVGDDRRLVHHQRHLDPRAARAWASDVGDRLAALPQRLDSHLRLVRHQQLRPGMGRSACATVFRPDRGRRAGAETVLFVLCRRSLHRLLLADLSIAAAEEITRDVGCAARRTIGARGE